MQPGESLQAAVTRGAKEVSKKNKANWDYLCQLEAAADVFGVPAERVWFYGRICRFGPGDRRGLRAAEDLLSQKQGPKESVREFIAQLRFLARKAKGDGGDKAAGGGACLRRSIRPSTTCMVNLAFPLRC